MSGWGGEGQAAAPQRLPSKATALPTTSGKTPTLSSEPCACALPPYKESNRTESRDCANYYETNASGLAVLNPQTGQPILLNFASGTGTYDLAYDPKTTTLTATLKIKVIPKEWQKLGPDGAVLMGKDGKPETIPYDADQVRASPDQTRPTFKEADAKDAHFDTTSMSPRMTPTSQ